jgi:ABC-type uncharacterized transport system permease subunit
MIDTKLLLNVLLHLLPVVYGVAFFNYLLVFFTDDKVAARLARPLLVSSVAANVLYLLGFTVYFEHIPLVTVYQVLGAIGFALAATYLWVETRTGSPYTGPFILFLALCCQVLNAVFPKLDHYVPEILQSTLFSIHVSTAVLGYSAFVVAAVYGFLYLLLYRNIRGKRFGLVFRRMPSLDVLDRMNYYASAWGFGLLTIGIVMGFVWAGQAFRDDPEVGPIHLDPKVLAALVTWVVFGLALLGRRFATWRGPKMALSSLIGFAVILFSVFGINFFFTHFHEIWR